jgi:hypothetical protein
MTNDKGAQQPGLISDFTRADFVPVNSQSRDCLASSRVFFMGVKCERRAA